MQIACKRFGCQKAVEVCYWSCKHRRDCKDWQGALNAFPGTDAVSAQLAAAAKKSGRNFDPQTMILTSKTKKNRAALVSPSPSAPLQAHLQSGGISTARGETKTGSSVGRNEPSSRKRTTKTKPVEVKGTMTEDNLDTVSVESPAEVADTSEPATETKNKPAAAKAKPKPAAPKPKPAPQPTGPIYLLLYANGKYKELRESELNTEAADILKDPSLRLIKGQALIPQISFRTADE
ncbi:MAG TPA: hypothetical protein PLD20_23050 [Blastocatellia bacterium]|nr:hypothetical protein [Blastocatellia bacterium]HMV84626.1 hypothetical protein [Blastocatellia bacterium]HMY75557.1 hypothetical protein [Blastocatellia bacterium]HMZ20831.1 hypothetical protein [Blastocatellia bacterium]HNG29033.1 hypothetical protein [Blastocatellia bacterium]